MPAFGVDIPQKVQVVQEEVPGHGQSWVVCFDHGGRRYYLPTGSATLPTPHLSQARPFGTSDLYRQVRDFWARVKEVEVVH